MKMGRIKILTLSAKVILDMVVDKSTFWGIEPQPSAL
jgi:hypothetical protein